MKQLSVEQNVKCYGTDKEKCQHSVEINIAEKVNREIYKKHKFKEKRTKNERIGFESKTLFL